MRFDLTEPCANCPFRTDDKRIRFRGRERAEEIEIHAYQNGFPCHQSAELREDPSTGEESVVFSENTQYCAGHAIMQIHEEGIAAWPGIGNNDELVADLERRLNLESAVFERIGDFLEANSKRDWR